METKNNIKLSTLIFLLLSFNSHADYELVKGKYGELGVILDLKTGGFAGSNPWFGEAHENIDDAANFWWEGSVEAGAAGTLNFFGGTEFYGAYSYIYSQSVGNDASGLSVDLNNPGDGDTEKAYAGWRSGSLFPTLGKNAIDISGGRQNYHIGSGFLIYNGAATGRTEGAYWIAPRQAFKETVIGKFNSGPIKFEVFHLRLNAAKVFNETGSTNGVNMEYAFNKANTLGFTYLHVYNTTDLVLDGLDVFNGRLDTTPLPFWPQLTLGAEYVFEQNNAQMKSNGGFAKITYEFRDTPWTPSLSFRFTGFQGDDPDTETNENFSSLAYGFSDWGTWYQGEIVGEYVLGNSNLLSYLVGLNVKPIKSVDMHLFYYHFEIAQPESLANNVTSSNFADEVDLISDWQVTDRFSVSAVFALAIPNEAARQFTGGKNTWFQSMLYAEWSL